MALASPAWAGSSIVVEDRARDPKAATYRSARRSAAASAPPCSIAEATALIAPASASASAATAAAWPSALFTASSFAAWDSRTTRAAFPSATLIADCLWPSDSRTCARFRLSASACSSMAARTPGGGWMSLISYRMQRRPQSAHASWMEATMAAFSEARSSKVLSSVIFPSSDRIVV